MVMRWHCFGNALHYFGRSHERSPKEGRLDNCAAARPINGNLMDFGSAVSGDWPSVTGCPAGKHADSKLGTGRFSTG